MADFVDTFTGSGYLDAHTSDSGSTWENLFSATGNLVSLSGGAAYDNQASGGGKEYATNYTAASADALGRILVNVGSLSGNPEVGIWLRCAGVHATGDMGYMGRYVHGTGYQFFTLNGNTYTQLGSTVTGTPLSNGDILDVKVVGSSPVVLSIYRNGTLVSTVNDSGNFLTAAGANGLHLYNPGGSVGVNYDVNAMWVGAATGPTLTCSVGSTTLTVGGATTTATATGFTGQVYSGSNPPTFTSSNTAVATVNSSSGVVTAVGAGTCTITATGAIFNLETAVSQTITVSGVAISVSPTTETVNQLASYTISATVIGSTNTAATFVSSAPSIATINSTTGVGAATTTAGQTTITATATADNTKTATSIVTVPNVGITLSPTTPSLSVNATDQFTATVTGSTNTGVTYSATGDGTINSSTGLFTSGSVTGSATITATAAANDTVTASTVATISSLQQYLAYVDNVATGITPTITGVYGLPAGTAISVSGASLAQIGSTGIWVYSFYANIIAGPSGVGFYNGITTVLAQARLTANPAGYVTTSAASQASEAEAVATLVGGAPFTGTIQSGSTLTSLVVAGLPYGTVSNVNVPNVFGANQLLYVLGQKVAIVGTPQFNATTGVYTFTIASGAIGYIPPNGTLVELV